MSTRPVVSSQGHRRLLRHRDLVRFLIAWLPVVVLAGCRSEEEGVVKREGEPDYVRAFDDERMRAAIAEARATLDTFVAALDARAEGSEGFAVKKGFSYGDGGTEFIWINEVSRDGDGFVGKVNNEPVDAAGVSLGQTVRVARADVADWMFLSRGRLRGGYTIVALVHGTPEQAKYGDSMGIDWKKYKFLGDAK